MNLRKIKFWVRDPVKLRRADFRIFVFSIALFVLGAEASVTGHAPNRADLPASPDLAGYGVRRLSEGWRFRFAGDCSWREVRVPHDASIGFDFGAASDDGNTGKLPWHTNGMYRLAFGLREEDVGESRYVALQFDGVMASPVVTLNGILVGRSEYGYLGFEVDCSHAAVVGTNLLEVTFDTRHHRSRWYPGCGIYRDVRLVTFPRNERVLPGTLFVRTLEANMERATVGVSYATPLYETNYTFCVEHPRLWDVDDPYLYELEVLNERVRYGIRTARFTPQDGFHLNGRRLQLKGVNLHADLGLLGMAFNVSAARRQLRIMKEMGVNALRTAHNPPAPQMLDLCDEMGIVVWDEAFDKWDATSGIPQGAKLEEYVAENLRQFVRRDRNHPSVVVWSIGNEIAPQGPHPWEGGRYYAEGTTRERCRTFRETIRALDTTRPVGMGCAFPEAVARGDLDDLDVTGWNYKERYVGVHAARPNMPLAYSESASEYSTFGYYNPFFPKRLLYDDWALSCSGYDHADHPDGVVWTDTPDHEFHRMERDRYCAGEFVWTGIDYLGEPSPFSDKSRSSYFGICDLCVFPKDRYYLYRSHWRPEVSTVHLLPHWTWKGHEGEKLPVYVYTNGDEAELFLNGKSLGRRRKGDVQQLDEAYTHRFDDYRLRWMDVVYKPGELRAVAYLKGVKIGEDVRRTAGRPQSVLLTSERRTLPADGETFAFVRVDVVDGCQVRVPDHEAEVSFELIGPGEIVSVGNGCEHETRSFKKTSAYPLFHGTACVVVRRTMPEGIFRLRASASGLESCEVSFME